MWCLGLKLLLFCSVKIIIKIIVKFSIYIISFPTVHGEIMLKIASEVPVVSVQIDRGRVPDQ